MRHASLGVHALPQQRGKVERSRSKARYPRMENFATAHVDTGETSIFVSSGGAGPPLLLLHGFPQTQLMWRAVAPLLAQSFTVVCADLRGYGQSGCPASSSDHAPY